MNDSGGIKHARYGDGQYLTNIDATQFTKWQVSRRLYGVPWKTSTLTHYIKIVSVDNRATEMICDDAV